MKDALIFSRRMRVTQPVAEAEKVISSDLQRGLSATVGAGTGYAPAKGVDVAMTTINELFKKQGITDEQLMRMLLTPEGADFLRQGSLTGASQKTLDALTNIPNALDSSTPAFSAISRLIAPTQQQAVSAPVQAEPEGVYVPEDIFMPDQTAPSTVPSDSGVFIPEDIFNETKNVNPKNDLSANEEQQLFNILGVAPKPSSMSGRNPELQVR